MIGGGPICVELAQGLARLGVRVTILQRGPRVLPREEPELAERLAAALRAERVEIVTDVEADRVDGRPPTARRPSTPGERSWTADGGLRRRGRTPNVDGLGLEELRREARPARASRSTPRMRTSVKSIYAAGDVAGRHHFTHAAGYEAARAVRNMFFPGTSRGAYLVPWCTFTDPELAHAGLTEAQARAQHGDDAVQRVAPGPRALRPRPHGVGADGELRIVTAKGRIVGAHVLAPARGRADRRAGAGDRARAEARRPRERRARLSDDRAGDPAARRAGELREGRALPLARALAA